MPRAHVIVNPASGRAIPAAGLARLLAPLEAAGWRLSVEESPGRGQVTGLARAAVEAGCSVVVAAGGDGTINEVIQALVGTPVALGVLPLGTANVWAREVGIPVDLAQAVRVLQQGHVRRIDVGRAGERYFLLMAGIGYDAEVTAGIHPRAKRALGILAYVVRGVTVAFSFVGRRVTITADGTERQYRVLLIVIGNARRYGGPLSITAEARIDDGLLDVCVFRGVGVLEAARYALQVLLGRHLRDPGVIYFRTANVSVSGDTPLPVQVDGDKIGTTPMGFSVHARALSVIVPSAVRPELFGAAQAADQLEVQS